MTRAGEYGGDHLRRGDPDVREQRRSYGRARRPPVPFPACHGIPVILPPVFHARRSRRATLIHYRARSGVEPDSPVPGTGVHRTPAGRPGRSHPGPRRPARVAASRARARLPAVGASHASPRALPSARAARRRARRAVSRSISSCRRRSSPSFRSISNVRTRSSASPPMSVR